MRKLLFIILSFCIFLNIRGEEKQDSLLKQGGKENVASEKITEPKGKYIYIPDSLQKDVLLLLRGGKKVVDDASAYSANDVTIIGGDTVPLMLKSPHYGRAKYNRGLFNHLFIPKGKWAFGLTASYGEFGTEDLDVFGLLTDIDLNIHAFSIRPSVQYFIRNNMAVGMRFGYNSMSGSIGSFKVDIDEDMNFSLADVMYRNEGYTAAFTFTQYIGLTRRGRFGIYNEVELAFASGNSDFRRPFGGELRETHTTYMDAALNFSPGVCVFIMDNVSFNLSLGVFGYHIRNEKQKEKGESVGNRFTSGANFRLNIFNINFGLGIHI
ncbi:MAG: hypothetical protein K2M13_02885 [Muribaculaceae bacterium]|nr:hypothetical protein [Muribaculaceae bacterium]